MTRTSRFALAALLGLAACTVNPDKIKPTVVDLCHEAASVMGDRSAECNGWALAWARWLFSSELSCAQWGAAVAAGRMAYDYSEAVQCISDLRSMSCDQLFGSGGSGPPGACAQAIRGLVKAGFPCSTGDECVSGTYCSYTSSCGGTCKAYMNLGQICYDSSIGVYNSCSPGLNCMQDPTPATTSRCQAPILAGAGCPNGWGCADGLYCDTSSGIPINYTCKADPQTGQACGLGYICANGLYCNNNSASPAYKTCQQQMTSGLCGQYNACLTPLYVCATPSYTWTSPGNCQAIEREGQPCQHGYGECVWGDYCKTTTATPATGDPGVCTVYPGPPGFCGSYGSEYVYCLDSYCNIPTGLTTGTCASFIPPGGACPAGGAYGECGPGNHCNTGVTPYICAVDCP